jgi:Cu2+-exporting ATPase
MEHHGTHETHDVKSGADELDSRIGHVAAEHRGAGSTGHVAHGAAADHDAHEHDRHASHSVAMFRDKFWLSFALTIPVVLLSSEVQDWFGYTVPSFPGSTYVPAILGKVVFLCGGLVFIRGALDLDPT